jgi:hypothetical protein
MVGLRSHGHGGGLTVLGASADADDRIELRTLALLPSRQAITLESAATSASLARTTISGERARRALAISRAALAARIAVVAPPLPRDTLSGTMLSTFSSDDEEVELRTSGLPEQNLERQWQGYVAGDEIAERAPIELAFATLAELLPPGSTAQPEDADRELLAEAWRSRFAHETWVEERLLELASVFGSGRVASRVSLALFSGAEGDRIRAVRAAAAITGRDAIHDARGRVRPFAEIAADYREQLAGLK